MFQPAAATEQHAAEKAEAQAAYDAALAAAKAEAETLSAQLAEAAEQLQEVARDKAAERSRSLDGDALVAQLRMQLAAAEQEQVKMGRDSGSQGRSTDNSMACSCSSLEWFLKQF